MNMDMEFEHVSMEDLARLPVWHMLAPSSPLEAFAVRK